LLSEEPLELVIFHFVLQVIIHQSLSHQPADGDFDFSLLLQESIVLTDFDLIVLNELEQLLFVLALFGKWSVCFHYPLRFLLQFSLSSWLFVGVQELSKLWIKIFQNVV
jgi:hypothetical protein